MNLSVIQQTKLLLSTPCILYFRHDHFPEEPHNFVVLNTSPLDDPHLYLVVGTSKIEKMKDRIRMKYVDGLSVVFIENGEYPEFRLATTFDCNTVHVLEWENIMKKIERNQVRRKDVHPELLRKIKAATLVSRKVDKNILNYIRV